MICAEILTFAKNISMTDLRKLDKEKILEEVFKDTPFLLKHLNTRSKKFAKKEPAKELDINSINPSLEAPPYNPHPLGF